MDRNEANNACFLHPNRCKQDTPVSKNRTEFSTTAVARQYKALAALQKGQGREIKDQYMLYACRR
ncbi:hypothetical protein T01_1520 [Trichinella spiralis]|uniref:Uncharacterized protein n=1 Tax=Trichinella spiralis TaxID=6334 RepID=A0A0V1APR0_TRISP|nr:hypothetical protein T01_1520 [Trichinella spiralis]